MTHDNDRPSEEEPLDILPSGTLAALTRAEIDVQVATAKQYPRSIAKFLKAATGMACMNEDIAASCFYSLPRGGKPITGPSVRLAEIAATAWGNIRFGARVIADDGRQITAQGMCHDLESNTAGSIEVKRRVTTKDGHRFSDDMIVVTGNAACAIAKRNAILGVIPRVYVHQVEQEARKVAIGDAQTLVERRAKMVDYFLKMGLRAEQVFAAVEKTSLEDIGLEELATLKGLATAIKEGDTTVDEAFPPLTMKSAPAKPNGTATEKLEEKLAGRGGIKTEAPKTEKPPAPIPDRQPGEDPPEDETELRRADLAENIRREIQESTAARDRDRLERAANLARQNEAFLGDLYGVLQGEFAQSLNFLTQAERYGKPQPAAAGRMRRTVQ